MSLSCDSSSATLSFFSVKGYNIAKAVGCHSYLLKTAEKQE